jgi:glucosamine-phosphate N-acetyltransferase
MVGWFAWLGGELECVVTPLGSLRNLGIVGHIEDIAVAKDQQGKRLGLRIIHALDYIAEKAGCYKAILDCSEANRVFYEKCGYKLAGVQMVSFDNSREEEDC